MRKKHKKNTSVGVRYSIGIKLVSIITIVLLVSLGAITALVSFMVSNDVRLTAENNNFTVNQRAASQAEQTLSAVQLDAMVLLDTLNDSSDDEEVARRAGYFFSRSRDVTAIIIPEKWDLFNGNFFATNGMDNNVANLFLATQADSLERAGNGQAVLQNATPFFSIPMLALFSPWEEINEGLVIRRAAVIFFSPEIITDSFGTGANSTFMVNSDADVLVHANGDLVSEGANMSANPFVANMMTSATQNFQSVYTDETGKRYFGAYQKLSLAGAAVITHIQYDVIFEGVQATTRRNMYLTGAVLFFAIMFVWFFSKSISNPLKDLAQAANKIAKGDYTFKLKPRGRDEIGLLTSSFVSMSQGLGERAVLMDTFARFTNRDLVERSLRGEVSLGGEAKQATIFFSDIRSFMTISENLSPTEVVRFLNEYMTRMVACVTKTGGVVDKYIGDAIMAVWGASHTSGSVAQDAMNCVRTALMMRRALWEFNKGRGSIKRPRIQMGCGINTGSVVAGQIGTNTRMEYTVIGDAVNIASRTEDLNKPLHTDILITENTWRYVANEIITEEMPPIMVKGKTKPVRMFAVVNMRAKGPGAAQPRPVNLREVRHMLGLSEPDLSKVDTNAKEKKYRLA